MLRALLEGKHFIVCKYHQALRWILDSKKSTIRLARWRLRLLKFDLEALQRRGAQLQASHARSRLLRKASERKLDPVDENILTQRMQSIGRRSRVLIMFLVQVSTLLLADAELVDAQNDDLLCWVMCKMEDRAELLPIRDRPTPPKVLYRQQRSDICGPEAPGRNTLLCITSKVSWTPNRSKNVWFFEEMILPSACTEKCVLVLVALPVVQEIPTVRQTPAFVEFISPVEPLECAVINNLGRSWGLSKEICSQ